MATALATGLVAAVLVVAPRAQQTRAASAAVAPSFKVDPSWPQEMPNQWIMGAVTGVFVDAKGHV
jgi:hypothetical protein